MPAANSREELALREVSTHVKISYLDNLFSRGIIREREYEEERELLLKQLSDDSDILSFLTKQAKAELGKGAILS